VVKVKALLALTVLTDFVAPFVRGHFDRRLL
jgi:hypothetical protein